MTITIKEGVTMQEITVKTSKELKNAMDNKYDVIYVEGELAEKIKKTEKLKHIGKKTLIAIIAAYAATKGMNSATKGLSAPMAQALFRTVSKEAGVTLSAETLMIIAGIGVLCVLAMYRDYDVELNVPGISVKLTRKK